MRDDTAPPFSFPAVCRKKVTADLDLTAAGSGRTAA